MRYIPASLQAKMNLLAQTKGNNADPRLETIIARHVIPIPSYSLWQTAPIVEGAAASRVSIAVARPDYRRMPTKIYTAGIWSGSAKIYSATFDGINAPTSWALEMTLAGAVDISLAFEGRFRPYKRRTEFYTTDDKPWIFWIDGSGDLYAQQWDDATTLTNLGAGATSISATMGVNSVQNDWGQGLLVAWTTTAGAVFYAQHFDEIWSDGITVTSAPENAAEVTISRVADYRIVFLVKNSSGAVTALFFRSIAHSMSNWEKVELLDASITEAAMTDITFSDTSTDEHVELASAEPGVYNYSNNVPASLSAYNIDDGIGDYGRFVAVEFDLDVYDFEDQAAAFNLIGTGGPFDCLSITRPTGGFPRNILLIEFVDFNNAVGDLTVSYTPGTISGGIETVQAFAETFTPTGLVPYIADPPIITGITDEMNQSIILTFDREVLTGTGSINDNTDAFSISGYEPPFFPMGPGVSAETASYVVSSVEFTDESHTQIQINLTYAGRLKYPQGLVSIQYTRSNGNLRGANGDYLPAQIVTFDPTSTTPWFNPAGLEKVELTAATVTATKTKIYYSSTEPAVERVEISGVSITNATLTHVNDL